MKKEEYITLPGDWKRVYIDKLYDSDKIKSFSESCPDYHKRLEELKFKIIQISHPEWIVK